MTISTASLSVFPNSCSPYAEEWNDPRLKLAWELGVDPFAAVLLECIE